MKTLGNNSAVSLNILRSTLVILAFLCHVSYKSFCITSNTVEKDKYTSVTSNLIKSNLEGCLEKEVWLDGVELNAATFIYNFYRQNNYTPVWTEKNKLTPKGEAALNLLKDSYRYGIEPSFFNIEELEQYSRALSKESNLKQMAGIGTRFEFLMTNSVFLFMFQISHGREFLNSIDIHDYEGDLAKDYTKFLQNVLSHSDIKQEILKLQPNNNNYKSLQHEMELIVCYIESVEKSKLDTTNNEVICNEFFTHLFANKGICDEKTDLSSPEIFTAKLIEFQDASGLRTSGKMDIATRNLISEQVRTKYSDIAFKLEAIRKDNDYKVGLSLK
ncbi:MAG: hypothetical protein JW894_06015 [Bacteroidales bacterium]|nr:hypothetical protein [Bacteroidales bacterium]